MFRPVRGSRDVVVVVLDARLAETDGDVRGGGSVAGGGREQMSHQHHTRNLRKRNGTE